MASEQHRRTIGDYVTLQRGTTYKGSLVGKPGPALLGLGSIEPGGGFRHSDYSTYGGECPANLMLFPGDLYVALKGATKDGKMIGSVARVPGAVSSGRLTQDTVKLSFREQNSDDANYLYWILRTPQYRAYCAAHAMGSAVVALSRQDFLNYPVPPLTSARKRLVALLEAIDDKIELNRRQNTTLEALARAIFTSWFVDFDPVRAKAEGRALAAMDATMATLFPDGFEEIDGRDVPRGWRVGRLSDVAENLRWGVDPSNLASETPYIGLEHMPRQSISLGEWGHSHGLESNKFKFARGEILFGKLRPYFHKVGVAPVDGVCSTDILVLRPKQSGWFAFVLNHVSSSVFVEYTNAASDGTKMPRTNWDYMARYEISIPSVQLAQASNDLINPFIERLIANIHQSRTLAALRDTLLPKLLSGEIRVRDAEAIVAKQM
ncbi:MAG: restriction endonuclease subunit S [Chloroflexales bacterium]|nr:restriction endonuclease subunit S [Chloroflexales bacterium]